jgi:hypothetical protein
LASSSPLNGNLLVDEPAPEAILGSISGSRPILSAIEHSPQIGTRWNSLPPAIRQTIVAIVEAATGVAGTQGERAGDKVDVAESDAANQLSSRSSRETVVADDVAELAPAAGLPAAPQSSFVTLQKQGLQTGGRTASQACHGITCWVEGHWEEGALAVDRP